MLNSPKSMKTKKTEPDAIDTFIVIPHADDPPAG